jgi:hypothetical protein
LQAGFPSFFPPDQVDVEWFFSVKGAARLQGLKTRLDPEICFTMRCRDSKHARSIIEADIHIFFLKHFYRHVVWESQLPCMCRSKALPDAAGWDLGRLLPELLTSSLLIWHM